jgi:hypothetical protein
VGLAIGFVTVVELNPVGGVHWYVTPAVEELVPITTALPAQTDLSTPAVALGKGLTVTTTVSFLVQPPSVFVAVTIYVVVTVGVAVGLAAVAELNAVVGDHR